MILGDLIKRNAALHGDRPGLVFEGLRYTHRQFAHRVYRAANALLDRGIRPQERVAMLSRNRSEILETFGAGEVAGFISVNINQRLSIPEVEDICLDAQPAALLYEPEFAEAAEAMRAKVPSLRLFMRFGNNAGPESYEAALAAASDAEPTVRASSEDIAYLIYTSGTTGKPKGVMYNHGAMLEAARTLSHESGALEPVTALIVMPLFHVGARIESFGFLYLGGTIVLHRVFDAVTVLETIQRERITAMHLAPIMIQRMLEVPNRESFDLRTLQCVHYASAPMPVPLLRRAIAAFGPVFHQVYGMTECLGGTTLKAHDHKLEGDEREVARLASAGQPYSGTELRIVRMDGSDADRDEIGEILIKSLATMKGYWNNTAATIETLRDGWMHTQDLGRLDGDGFLYVVDRKKDMIISGGENIYSWEVEEALRHHPAVAEVAVIAVPDPEWGEAVKACVVLREGMCAGQDELIAHCRSRIASYKKPRSVEFVAALPRLFNGKIDKKALRTPYWNRQERQVS
jgi:acyl-CoA synthetase (AMP-forming)/AMP-acid ligase II